MSQWGSKNYPLQLITSGVGEAGRKSLSFGNYLQPFQFEGWREKLQSISILLRDWYVCVRANDFWLPSLTSWQKLESDAGCQPRLCSLLLLWLKEGGGGGTRRLLPGLFSAHWKLTCEGRDLLAGYTLWRVFQWGQLHLCSLGFVQVKTQ